MFGIIVSGRPVTTEAQPVAPTQLAFRIPSQPSFQHIVVFLLPGNVLPPDQAAAVYIQIPPSAEFKLLGALANDKPSVIFRVREHAAAATSQGATINGAAVGDIDEDAMVDEGGAAGAIPTAPETGDIMVGIALEPAVQVAQALAAQKAAGKAVLNTGLEIVKAASPLQGIGSRVPTGVLAKRIIENAYDYLASFATSVGGKEMVPLKSFQDWWKKFEAKIEKDPSFLEKAEGS